ncbi:uncharacterized protein DUF3164 [Defluviimonas denitrificans]|uniref:Uncharacterized protein DUF3164 n=1 Tax=Albidovulum denitrificans TaxID=404881 RepID=A0A2S8S6E3_9RHOB|nr:DUF3164 family protein [Defluviimonas denitrificans]PQV56377.1 uncharacterized protein DUF3164 [Defluviimonas denitrificans]
MTPEPRPYPPAKIPTGRVMIEGDEHILGPDGAKLPIGTVKPQNVMEDELVRAEMSHAVALSEQLSRFLGHFHANLDAFEALLAEQYGATVGGKKGNKTLMSYDGLLKITVQVADNIQFGPELQIAKTLVDECLNEWTASAEAPLKAVITKAFNTDKEGQINRAALYSLLRLEIADERWKSAMKAIRDAMRVVGSKSYVRFYRRETADAPWEAVTIDLAKA